MKVGRRSVASIGEYRDNIENYTTRWEQTKIRCAHWMMILDTSSEDDKKKNT